MRITKSSGSKKTKIILTAIVAVVLLGVGVMGWYLNTTNEDTKRDAKGVSLERTPQDIKLEEELEKDPGKKESTQSDLPDDPQKDSSTGLKSVNVVLTSAGQSGDKISASGFVSNTVESDGKCTYVFMNGQKKVEKSTSTLANPTSTTCASVMFNKSELSAGVWKVQVSYSSTSSSGVSNEMEVAVE